MGLIWLLGSLGASLLVALLWWFIEPREVTSRKLFFAACAIFVVSVIAQSILFVENKLYRTLTVKTVLLNGGSRQLNLLYPDTLAYATSDTPTAAMLFWLDPVTATNPVTYTVVLTPVDQGITFVDKDGQLTPAILALSTQDSTAQTLYLQRTIDNETNPFAAIVTVQEQTGSGLFLRHQEELQINLEIAFFAGLRYLFTVYFNATTSLLAVVATLGGFAIQKWMEDQAERQEEQKENLRQLSAEIGPLITQNLGQALEKWTDFSESKEAAWATREVREKLDELWERINQEAWQRVALEQFIASENHPLTLLRLVEKKSADKEKIEVKAASYLMGYQDTEAVIKTLGGEPAMLKIILWLFKEIKNSQSFLIAPLLQRIDHSHDTICLVEELISRDIDGLRLLKQEEFTDVLTKLETADQASKEQSVKIQSYAKLLNFRRKAYWQSWEIWQSWESDLDEQAQQVAYLSFSPKRPAQETAAIPDWLKEMGLTFNPFTPERAENDPRLLGCWVPPVRWTEITLSSATLVYGSEGSGKTAIALMLAYECANPLRNSRLAKTFPFYWSQPIEALETALGEPPYEFLASIMGESLIRFIAVNPHVFTEHTAAGQSALLLCMIHAVHTIDELKIRLLHLGLPKDGVGQQLYESLDKSATTLTARKFKEETWLEIFKTARPQNFHLSYLLLDIHSPLLHHYDLSLIAHWLQALLQVGSRLSAAGVYLKLFIPDTLWVALAKMTKIGVSQIALQWTKDDLQRLLERRLDHRSHDRNSPKDINALFDSHARVSTPMPDELWLNAVKTPRELLQLGARLLSHHTGKNSIPADDSTVKGFTYEELEDAIGRSTTS